jgi:hypothetical protein
MFTSGLFSRGNHPINFKLQRRFWEVTASKGGQEIMGF